MEFDINDVASIGAVADVPPYMLPPEAWNIALNMRYEDDGLTSLDGWEQVFGTPLIAPHFAVSMVTQNSSFWVYSSLAAIAVYDGTSHTSLTRTVGGAYTATETAQWNSTILGGILILNNGNDVPQYWADPDVTVKMANLTNWPTTHRAKVIRAFGPFLVAFNITISGDSFPHRVLWSHPADPGSIPVSYDVADPDKDTGEVELSDVQSGVIVDALPLGSTMFVYKEASVWRMRYVGGQSIFDFGQSSWITTAGLLGPRCVCVTGDGQKHVFATQDDIFWHNGNTVASILNKKQRKKLQNDIDPEHFGNSFIWPNPFNNEVWFCYPGVGQEFPDRALVMNYQTPGNDVFTVTEADGITFRNAAAGAIDVGTPEIWDTGSDTWLDDTGGWSEIARRRVVLSNPVDSKLMLLGGVTTRDGDEFQTTLQRVGISLIGKKRNGDLIVDHQRWKMLKRLWPKIQGGPVTMRFGAQEVVDGSVTFGPDVSYDPTEQVYCDPGIVSGRAVGFEIIGTSSAPFRIDGYKIDMTAMGQY